MDLRPPRVGEVIAGASGAVLLLSLFLPWYRGREIVCTQVEGLDCPSIDAPGTAWEAFALLDLVLAFLALAGIGLLVQQMTQRTTAVPVAWAALTAPVGFVATVCVLVRTLSPPADDVEPLFVLLGLAAAAGVTVGALLSMRDEGFGVRPRPGIRATLARGGRDQGPEPIPVSDPGGDPRARRER